MTRRRAIIAGVAFAALLVAFLGGRWTAHPAPIATKDTRKAETTTQATATTASTAHVEAIAHESATGDTDAKTHTIIRWLPAVPAANGCPAVPAHVEQDTTTETHAATTRTADKQLNAIARRRAESAVDVRTTTVELHTVTPVRPSWSVSLMPGAQLFGEKAITLFGPLVLGASVEHRFIGPVSLGVHASTSGEAGITLRTEF